FPLGVMANEALGAPLLMAIAVLMGAYATLVAPLFPRARYGFIATALALVCALVAIAQPAYTKEKPRFIPLAYIDDARAKTPVWSTWTATEQLRRVAPFVADSSTPWNRGATYTAPAPRIDMPRVAVTGERDANIVTIRVRSPRRADRLSVTVRGGVVRRVNGLAPPDGRHSGRSRRGWQSASATGVEELVVEVAGTGRVEAAASDLSYGFPPSGAALLRARDASTATTIQDGDTTVTRAWGSW
ncbi:MAG TPA: hypothetical protein VE010_05350, partial [Thermoanaerobaculia bacterium]|nr:hypothetical protein [Thermoanaerobaculia bacterium]